MLFLVKHVHTHATCPAVHDDVSGTFGKVMSDENLANTGVQVNAAYIDVSGHTAYIVADAPSTLALQRFLAPLLAIGSAETTPVLTAQEAMEMVQDTN